MRSSTRASVGIALFATIGSTLPGGAWADTLVSVLERLRAQGIDLIYSSELVTPDMQIPAESATADPLTRARTALAAHGLELRNVGLNRFIVTQARTQAVAAEAAPSAAPPSPPPEPQEVSIYASRYDLAGENPGEPRVLSTAQIEQVPGTQDDVLRAARVIPGVASNLSTRPYIRGAFVDDVLVQFDGVPLDDPFHLKNFQSLISAFDPAAVERIEVYSGGFPVRYGTKSGGVINVEPRSLASGYEHAVGASLLAYDASSVGHAEKWPVDWLATVRRSVSDVVVKPVNAQEGEPRFMDSLGRVRWHGEDGSAWTLGWLLLNDRIDLSTTATDEVTNASYRDEYAWLAYESSREDVLHSRTVLAATWADRSRAGVLNDPGLAIGTLQESRDFSSVDLRSLWTYKPSARLVWTYGLEAVHSKAELRYNRNGQIDDAIAASFGRVAGNALLASATPKVTAYAASIAARRRWSRVEGELGLRLDAQRYSTSGLRRQCSPRLNVRYDLASRWRLYGSWGRFTQAQRVDEWRLEESQMRPDPAALSVHTILGVAYDESGGTRVSLELYRKRWTEVRPYFDNLFDTLSLVPDLKPDRVRIAPRSSEAAGVELSVRRSLGRSTEGWAAYAYSRVTDDFANRDDVVRTWDQPHALTVGLAWTARPWNAALVLGWHRGWPKTPWSFSPATVSSPASLQIGLRNGARWADYFSADLSAAWTHPLPRSELSLWLEVTNSTDRRNECCAHLIASPAGQSLTEPNYYLPRTVNAGVSWRFRGGQ